MTELNFKGKEFVYNHHLAVPFRPLVPHERKGIGPVAFDGNLIIHGDKDAVVPHRDVTTLVEKLKTQKGIVIEQKIIPGANHFFDGKVEPLMGSIGTYLDKRLKLDRRPSAA